LKNETKILLHIVREKRIRRKDLEAIISVTPSTMTYLLDKLKNFIDIEEEVPTLGKPPQFLSISKNAWKILAVSVGREKIRAVLYNAKGEELESFEHRVKKEDLSNDGINNVLQQSIDKFYDYDSIGIAFSGTIHDEIVDSKILSLRDYDPVRSLRLKSLGVPYIIISDVEAIAAYESKKTGKDKVFVLNYGTGIGACYYEYHALFSRDEFKNIPFGHMYAGGNEQCYCGNVGCLETVASDYVIVKKFYDKNLNFIDFINREEEYWKILKVVRNLHKTDEANARELYKEVIEHLAMTLGNTSVLLGINEITLYGEGASKWLAEQLEEKINSLAKNFSISVKYGNTLDAVERGVSLEAAINLIKKKITK